MTLVASPDRLANWFDAASLAEADRLKIGRSNAIHLFGLRL